MSQYSDYIKERNVAMLRTTHEALKPIVQRNIAQAAQHNGPQHPLQNTKIKLDFTSDSALGSVDRYRGLFLRKMATFHIDSLHN